MERFFSQFFLRLTSSDVEDDKKVLCQLLNKLHIPDTVDDDQIKELKLLMHNLRLVGPLFPYFVHILMFPLKSVVHLVTLLPGTPLPSSKQRFARSSRNSWKALMKTSIGSWNSCRSCSHSWMTLFLMMMMKLSMSMSKRRGGRGTGFILFPITLILITHSLRYRRSESIVSTSTEGDREDSTSVDSRRKSKTKHK